MRILETQLQNGDAVRFIPIEPDKALELWPSITHHAQAALEHSVDDMTPVQLLNWVIQDKIILILIKEHVWMSKSYFRP